VLVHASPCPANQPAKKTALVRPTSLITPLATVPDPAWQRKHRRSGWEKGHTVEIVALNHDVQTTHALTLSGKGA